MKVNIDQTIEVTDERRKQIALAIDGPGSKKRDATRQELKDFLWNNGAEWETYLDQVLDADESEEREEPETAAEEPEEDLLGTSDPDAPDEDLLGAPVAEEADDEDLLG